MTKLICLIEADFRYLFQIICSGDFSLIQWQTTMHSNDKIVCVPVVVCAPANYRYQRLGIRRLELAFESPLSSSTQLRHYLHCHSAAVKADAFLGLKFVVFKQCSTVWTRKTRIPIVSNTFVMLIFHEIFSAKRERKINNSLYQSSAIVSQARNLAA